MRAREFLSDATLNRRDMNRYEDDPDRDRVPIFLEKILMQTPFTIKTAAGEEEVIFDPSQYDEIAQNLKQKNTNFQLKTMEDPPRFIPFGKIKKTSEFGGEGSFSRETQEKLQIAGLSEELEKLKAGQPFIKLLVGKGATVKDAFNAARFEKTPGKVKSDMTVFNENNEPVAYVSLKANNFKKWGGFTHLIGLYPIIKTWVDKIKELTGGELSPRKSYGLHLTDNTIKNKIVFGKDFGKDFGVSNVNCVLIGKLSIVPAGEGVFKLNGNTVYNNGDTPTGVYEPYLAVRFATDRPDLGIKNARAETNTKNETRKVEWLDNLTPTTPNVPVTPPPPSTTATIATQTIPGVAPVQDTSTPGIRNQTRTMQGSKEIMGQQQGV